MKMNPTMKELKPIDALSPSGYNHRIKFMYKQYIKSQKDYESSYSTVDYETMLSKWDAYKECKSMAPYWRKKNSKPRL